MRQALLGRANLDKVATQVGLDRKAVNSPEDRDAVDHRISARASASRSSRRPCAIRASRTRCIASRYQDSDRAERAQGRRHAAELVRRRHDGLGRPAPRPRNASCASRSRDYDQRLRDAENRGSRISRRRTSASCPARRAILPRLSTETQEVKQLAGRARHRGEPQGRAAAPAARRDRRTCRPPARRPTPLEQRHQSRRPHRTPRRASQETQARLDDLLLRFTDKHPDVIAARETLKQLQDRQNEEIAALGAAIRARRPCPARREPRLPEHPAAAEPGRRRDRGAAASQLAEHRRNEAELRQLVDHGAGSRSRVRAPHARLRRHSRRSTTTLLERLEKAKVSSDADQTGMIRFNIVDPPTVVVPAHVPESSVAARRSCSWSVS